MTDASIYKIFRYMFWAITAFAVLYIFYLLSDIIIILVVSLLLSLIFNPFVTLLEKEGFNRLLSTLGIFLALGFLIYLGLSFVIPKLLFQMNQLINTLHVYSIHDQIISVETHLHKYFPFFTPGELSKRIEDFFSSQITHSFDKLSTLLSSIISVIALVVIIPFITFFLLKDYRLLLKGVMQIMPNNYFEMSYWITKRVSVQLGRFVRGWIFDASFVGITMGIGFYFLGIQNSLPLGVIAGLGHLVPYLGPIVGGVPAIIISIIQYGDLSQVPYIILLISSVYALDNGFVQPYVFAKSVDMHPIIIILIIIAGSQLFGIIGMLLAVPTTSVIKTAAKEIYFALKNYRIAKI